MFINFVILSETNEVRVSVVEGYAERKILTFI